MTAILDLTQCINLRIEWENFRNQLIGNLLWNRDYSIRITVGSIRFPGKINETLSEHNKEWEDFGNSFKILVTHKFDAHCIN